MRIVTAETMRKAERLTIGDRGIPGRLLMETAGRACADVVCAEWGTGNGKRAVIVAGKGNNGGDGYVVARCLLRRDWNVAILVLAERKDITGDAVENLTLLDPSIITFCPAHGDMRLHAEVFRNASIIVDALFGIGLNTEVSGAYAEAVEMINSSGRPVLAVDIPSGIDASTGRVLGDAVHADVTVTFGFAKVGHVVYPGREYTGKLKVVDIGIPNEIAASMETHEFLDVKSVQPLVKPRAKCGHKGNFGHCLIVAGATGKTGAASLAANSAVRTGSGLVTLAVPASLNPVLEVKTTEAMTLPVDDAGKGFLGVGNSDAILRATQGKDAIAIGPGISREPETIALVRRLVKDALLPMVVDADGLNAIAEDVAILDQKRSPAIVLTPHPGEMSRLSGLSISEIEDDRISAARSFAVRYGVFLVLKGAGTVIATPGGEIAVNGSGNPGMGSGGMGDVLTGILVSLLGQNYTPAEACRLGVFLHGFAADLVAQEKGEIGLSATDVQERLPLAYKEILDSLRRV
jgi:ADP-dependent NAD(P)H-hydrate dehydratase / NAD(P)H-hydrate epimerase